MVATKNIDFGDADRKINMTKREHTKNANEISQERFGKNFSELNQKQKSDIGIMLLAKVAGFLVSKLIFERIEKQNKKQNDAIATKH